MKKKRPSLKDIAKKLDVSVTTVSFILNGKGKEKKISDEVINRALAYVDEINYKPNYVAQSLRTGKTKILVFMVEDIGNYFFARLARIIEDLAYEKDYKVIFCSNENKDQRSRELINIFYERQVDGFIIIPSSGIKEDIEMLIANNVPVILFDRYFPELDTHYVVIDNRKATYEGTQHLVEMGFSNIGFITTDVAQTQMSDRLAGYSQAVAENSLIQYVLKIPFSETNTERGKKLFQEFLKKNPKMDAVFFATNYLTHTGLEVIKENHPHKVYELGIITFDDHDLFKIYSPSISAVAQPLEEIGKHLMKIMLGLLEGKQIAGSSSKVVLDTKLVVRESSVVNN